MRRQMFEVAGLDDVTSIAALMNRAYRGVGAAAGWTSESSYIVGNRTSESMLREELLSKPDGTFLKWIEASGGEPLGCVWLEPIGNGVWYLGSLATEPAQQNAGLGKTLLGAAEQWIHNRGGRRVRLTVVNVRDTLIPWYVRRGYHVTGETHPFPYGDNRFGTPLRDDLHFVVLEKALIPIGG